MNEDPARASLVSDEELTALALSADPHPPIDLSVAPWHPTADGLVGLLPEWYMPTPYGARRGGATKFAIGVVVAGFVLINALGLCITYGYISLA